VVAANQVETLHALCEEAARLCFVGDAALPVDSNGRQIGPRVVEHRVGVELVGDHAVAERAATAWCELVDGLRARRRNVSRTASVPAGLDERERVA
jgi:hypothetical protein